MLDRSEAQDGLTEIAGARIELIKRGSGRPLLLLHPATGIKATDAVIDRLARHLAPAGLLFLGHAETLHGAAHALKHVGPTAYARS